MINWCAVRFVDCRLCAEPLRDWEKEDYGCDGDICGYCRAYIGEGFDSIEWINKVLIAMAGGKQHKIITASKHARMHDN